MKHIFAVLAAALLALSVSGAAHAQNTAQVCEGLDSGKIDVSGSVETITVTAPNGFLIDGYCVKAGSAQQGNGPEYVEVDPPQASVTFGHSSGKDASHYSVSYTQAPTATPTRTPTATETPNATDTATPTASATSTVEPTHTRTHTPSATPTTQGSSTATSTRTATTTSTATPVSTATPMGGLVPPVNITGPNTGTGVADCDSRSALLSWTVVGFLAGCLAVAMAYVFHEQPERK